MHCLGFYKRILFDKTMWGLIAGAAAGLGLGIWQGIEGANAADGMAAQAERNRQLANQQADWMTQNWNELAKPAMIRQQVLERDAQEGQLSDSGVLANMGSALVARYYTMKNQNLELTTKDREITQQAYITREQGQIAYQEGMIQSRVQKMNSIFGGLGTATSLITLGNQFKIGSDIVPAKSR